MFEEFEPRTGCACAGCVHGRRAVSVSSRSRRTGCLTVRKAVALAAVAGATLAAGQAMPVAAAAQVPLRPGVPTGDQPPDTPQGRTAPLHGSGGVSAPALAPAATRAQIINRAKVWVAAKVPYSMDDYWSDGYRQDCSGFVSMAWNLGSNEWTGSLDKFGVRISKEEMQPGDILLFHNAANPERGSHVVIFGGWTDYTHKKYTAYEETPPRARKLATPYAYWTNSSRYVPYRYKNLTESKAAEGTDEQPPASAGVPGVPPATRAALWPVRARSRCPVLRPGPWDSRRARSRPRPVRPPWPPDRGPSPRAACPTIRARACSGRARTTRTSPGWVAG
ncbi:NlpC/P60 family protein [Streptomyces chiangmaiensis]